MKTNYKRTTYILAVALTASLLVTISVLAGNINSSAAPGATNSYTLADIYARLIAGTAGAQSTFTEPVNGPGTTMNDLNAIMAAAPVLDAANGAIAADVASGQTFWGLTSGAWGLRTGTGYLATYLAVVPKTGDAYDDPGSTGEDGELQRGVAWPNPRFTAGGDNNGDGDCLDGDETCDGTVTDNLTGLIWLTNAHCAAAARTWATALTDVASLNSAGTMNGHNCGDTSNGSSYQTDWRLPNVRELQSLVHYGYSSPAVPNTAGTGQWSAGDPFTNVQSYYYWSSTSYADYTVYAWSVPLYDGSVYCDEKTRSYYVWPVRAGQ